MHSAIKAEWVVEAPDVVSELKLSKTELELQGYRNSQIRDGASLAKFFSWLESELIEHNSVITEYEAGVQLLKFKENVPLYMGPSFAPIFGSGENGAIVHYSAQKDACSAIDKSKMLLCDCGGQYLDGTTDTTRTFHFTSPNSLEKEMYTRVLKGNLDLERIKFPLK